MRISIVTVCRDAAATIADTISSVSSQTHGDVEHIIVDGASTDGTQDIIREHETAIARWVSESDKGIYDAMNKGVAMASGEILGFLNADDIYARPDVLEKIAATFDREKVEACYGDIVFVRDDMETVVRYYRSRSFTPKRLAYGWMPAHPGLYLKKSLFDKYGVFKTDYRIAADYELIVRLFGVNAITYRYIPEVLVKMRLGGVSTRGFRSNLVLNQEIVRACRENGISTNLLKVSLKFPLKMLELVIHPT